MIPLLADTSTWNDPILLLVTAVAALAGVCGVLFKLLLSAWKREQDRSDALAKIVNSWLPNNPGEE